MSHIPELRVRDHLGEGGGAFDGLRISRSSGSRVSAQDYENIFLPIYYYLKTCLKIINVVCLTLGSPENRLEEAKLACQSRDWQALACVTCFCTNRELRNPTAQRFKSGVCKLWLIAQI